MAELPILPLKTDALLADTTHMSPAEFGAYCRILFVMWRHGGSLKEDDGELAAIAGLTPVKWQRIKERVMRPMTSAGGSISQKRLTDTWMQVQEVRRKRAEAADRRWSPKGRANAMQVHQQKQSNSNANQNQKKNTTSSVERESSGAGMHLHPSEQAEKPEGATEGNMLKRPDQVSRTELAALYEKQRKPTELEPAHG